MKLQRLLLLILALTMVLTLFAACKKDGEGEITGDDEVATVEDTDENPNLAPINGEGRDFNIFCREGGKEYLYKYDEVRDTEDYGDAVNVSVCERNYFIEEKYNVVITTTTTTFNMTESVEKDIAAGLKSYDIIMPMVEHGFFMACNGYLTEWDNIPFVDETKSYWMTHVYDATSIGGYQFMLPGALNLSAYNTVQVMFFNKQMHNDLGLENIYDLVKEKKWTQEVMYGMAERATSDLDGGGMGTEDQYGVVSGSVCWQSYYYASGKTMVTKDENDLPVLTSLGDNISTTYDMISYIVTNMNDNSKAGTSNLIGWSGAVPEHFAANKCLFFIEGIYGQYKILDMENDYGIVPVATWEEGANYYSFIHATHSSVSAIPYFVKDLTLSGSILEDLMYYSDVMVIPTYYEDVIHTRNVRDTESYEMLDIIFENIIIDLAQVMKSTGLTIDNDIRGFIDTNSTDTISSTLGGNKAVYESVINLLATAFTSEGAKQYAN